MYLATDGTDATRSVADSARGRGPEAPRRTGRKSGAAGVFAFTLTGTHVTQGAVDQWRKQHPYNRIEPRSFPPPVAERQVENVSRLARIQLSTFELLSEGETGSSQSRYGQARHRITEADDKAALAATDGNLHTTWKTRTWERTTVHEDLRRSCLELHWDAPISVHSVTIRQQHDRATYFTVEAAKDVSSRWFVLAIFQGQTHGTSVSGDRSPQWARIDDLQPDQLGDRVFGSDPNNNQQTSFEFFLPRPRSIRKLMVRIRQATAEPVEIAEVEVYGTISKE